MKITQKTFILVFMIFGVVLVLTNQVSPWVFLLICLSTFKIEGEIDL